MAKIHVDETDVKASNNKVKIESTVPNANIDVKQSITAKVEPDNYVIASQGYSAGVPGWLSTAVASMVKDSIGTGGTLADALDTLRTDVMDQIQLGVNQAITQIENQYVSSSALTTTLASEIGASRSAILNQVQTYADGTQALATDVNALKSSFGGTDAGTIEAFIGSVSTTAATGKYASAQTVDVLTANYNNIEPRLTSTEFTVAGQFTEWDGTSTPQPGMFKIFDGSYWNYVGGTLGEFGDGWMRTDRNALDGVAALASSTTTRMNALQLQVDNSITTWFEDYSADVANNYLPTLNNVPAINWITIDNTNGNDIEKTKHIGDLVYDKSTGYAYRFAHEDLPNDIPNLGIIWSWILITDVDVTKALADAARAQDTADHKRVIYSGSTIPSGSVAAPLSTGDMWIPSGYTGPGFTDGEIYLYVIGASNPGPWVLSTRYSQAITDVITELHNWQNGAYSTFVKDIQVQVDHKAESYYVETDPSISWSGVASTHVGDLWKKPSDNTEYVWKLSGGTYKWVPMDVPNIVYDTIDTKKSVYTGNSVPSPVAPDKVQVNDLWIVGSNPVAGYEAQSIYMYKAQGTSPETYAWELPLKYTDNTAVVVLQTGIENGTVNIDLTKATINGGTPLTAYVSGEVDKQVVVYSGTDHSLQSGMKLNDIYIEKTVDTSGAVDVDVVNTYKYNGSTWTQIGNNSNITALADLTDGKRTIYSGNQTPQGTTANPLQDNDLFIPTMDFTDATTTTGYVKNEMYRYSSGSWVKATRYDTLKNELNAQIIDNKVETYYQDTIPFGNLVTVNKDPHSGDYWFCTANTNGSGYKKGVIYKFVETVSTIDSTKFDYTWGASQDVSKGAFDLADKKRTIYGDAGNSIPNKTNHPKLELNDLWMPSADSTDRTYKASQIYKCTVVGTNNTDVKWTKADYTNDDTVNNITNGSIPLDPSKISIGSTTKKLSDYVSSEADKRVHIYSGTTAPVNGHPVGVETNDIYLWNTTATAPTEGSTYDVVRTYKYLMNGTWGEVTTNTNITALADLADGKRTVYSNASNDVPKGEPNDLWIPTHGTNDSVYIPKEVYQYANGWKVATKYTENLTNFANAINPKVNLLEAQRDHKIEYFFQLSTATDPKASWTTQAIRDNHNGDILYHTDTELAYRYYAVDDTWHEDQTLVKALSKAAQAQATADGKVTTFYQATAPIAEGVGDLWVDSDNNNKYHRWNGIMWEYMRDSSNDVAINQGLADALSSAAAAQATADNRVISYYQATMPTTAVIGDIWFDTSNGNKVHTYNGTTWVVTQDSQIGQAILDAADAQSTADGKRTIFYQNTTPITTDIGDLWVDSSTKVTKTWSGSTWVDTTNTTANQAASWAAGASKLITSPDGSITGWEFGDSSGTQSEFKINTQNFKISDGTNSANVPFSIVTGIPNKVQFNGVVNFTNTNMSGYDNSNVTPGLIGAPTTSQAQGFANTAETNAKNHTNYQLNNYVFAPGTTTIDGGKINTDTIDVRNIFSKNITYTGTITGGSGGLGGIIQSKNFVTSGGTDGMKIDLVNGSIYIA